MLEISHLTKKYKNSNFYSVKDLSFTLKDGEIFGFLGKNGAGKSTTIKCITGILPFDEGTIKVCGYDVAKDPIQAKLNIGYVPDNHAVYENLTGTEYVNYMGNIYRVPKDVIKERLQKFAKLFSMEHAIDNQIRSYSHGMKQKICIIAALIHNPKFWVLDEPLMGLDPQSTYEIKQYMKEHKKLGNTVFFSSHNIDMVEKLCDRVAIINRGQLMEIIDVKKFTKESKIPLEDYFLNLTKDSKAKVILAETKEEKKKRLKKERKVKLSGIFGWFKKKSKETDETIEEDKKQTVNASKNDEIVAKIKKPSDTSNVEKQKKEKTVETQPETKTLAGSVKRSKSKVDADKTDSEKTQKTIKSPKQKKENDR